MADKEVRRGTGYPDPIKGDGYFNRGGCGYGMAKALRAAREPFTTVDAEGREDVKITAPGYREAQDKAFKDYYGGMDRAQKDSVQADPAWEMPWRERESLMKACQGAHCYDEDTFNSLAEQADAFGMDSLKEDEQLIVDKGPSTFKSMAGFIEANGLNLDEEGPVPGSIQDTGRYVKLKSPDGETSQLLMEIEPMMDVHRFVDLEAPEGQGQILELKEGDYTVDSVYGDCQAVRDGIENAKAVEKQMHGTFFSSRCGNYKESELYKEAVKVAGTEDRIEPLELEMDEGDEPLGLPVEAESPLMAKLNGRVDQMDAGDMDSPDEGYEK